MLRHLLKSEEFLKENSDHVTVLPKTLQWWFPALETNPCSYRGVDFACSGPSFLSSGISTISLQPPPVPIQPHQPLASRQRCFPSSWCPPCPSPCPSISAGSPALSSCWSWLKRHLHGEVSPKPLINVGSPKPTCLLSIFFLFFLHSTSSNLQFLIYCFSRLSSPQERKFHEGKKRVCPVRGWNNPDIYQSRWLVSGTELPWVSDPAASPQEMALWL